MDGGLSFWQIMAIIFYVFFALAAGVVVVFDIIEHYIDDESLRRYDVVFSIVFAPGVLVVGIFGITVALAIKVMEWLDKPL